MSNGLYSGASGFALGTGLYKDVSGLWSGASGFITGFGGDAPVNTVPPVISATFITLSVTTGTWTGTSPITYTYQWFRNGAPIGGATASTYVIPIALLGANFSCVVTASNSAGSGNAAATAVYIGPQIANFSIPYNSGLGPFFFF